MTKLRIYLLGSPQIEFDGTPVELDTRKATALLSYLIVTGRGHRRDTLAALLWPEYDHHHAMGAFRRTLSALRKTIGENHLEVTRESVKLSPAMPVWSDYVRFYDLLADCKTHGHPSNEVCPACLPLLEESTRLYRNHFLAGFTLRDSPEFDEWEFFTAETLRRDFSGVLERLVYGYSAIGDFPTAISHAQRWLSMDALQESAHRQLMRLFAWSGQRSASLRQYQECTRILHKELGVSPLEETSDLFEIIKADRLPPPTKLVSTNGIKNKSFHGTNQKLSDDIEDQGSLFKKSSPIFNNLPLVGRSLEWNILQSIYGTVSRNGHFLVLEGEAGIGKTRLAEEFLEAQRSSGATILTARCYQGEDHLAYAPIVESLQNALEQMASNRWWKNIPPEWLSEAARLIPEIAQLPVNLPISPSIEGSSFQARFLEGLSQVILSICKNYPPGVIFIDDLHWADQGTLAVITYLVRRLRGRPVVLLATWRSEEISSDHSLRSLLAEAQRAGTGTLLSLEPFSHACVRELVQAALAVNDHSSELLSERLYHETDGLPFFVVEYLQAIINGGQNGDAKVWAMPGSVRDLLRSRLSPVSETGKQLIQTAAVIGRSFGFHVLYEVSGRSEEETVSALESLIRHGLIREVQGASTEIERGGFQDLTYDFSHEKIRDLVYEETSQARRKILHRRVAEALALRARSRREANAMAGLIARHYQMAGMKEESAEYFFFAGDYSRSLYANAEALSHYRAALELGYPRPEVVNEAIGDLQVLSGDYRAAQSSYEALLPLHQSDISAVTCLEHKLGIVFHRQGEWEQAEKHYQAALSRFEFKLEPEGVISSEGSLAGEAARIYADWSLTAHNQGQPGRAVELAHKALDLSIMAGDTPALAQSHNILGILARSQGELAPARTSLEQSLSLAEALGDPGARVAALNNLALVYSSSGDIKKAINLTEAALNLCISQGDRHREAALHNNMADLLHSAGLTEAAMAHLKQAVSIFTEIGVPQSVGPDNKRPASYQPEIWKLSEW